MPPDRHVFATVLGGVACELSPDPFLDLAPEGATQLDPQETSVPQHSRQTYADWIKDTDPLESLATEQALAITLKPRKGDLYDRYRSCRTQAYFFRHRETGEVRVVGQSCKIRWCYICGRSKAQVLSRRLTAWTQAARHPKLLTLTLRHSPAPLIDQLTALYTFFRRLRLHPLTKKALLAGHWFVQLTYNSETHCWHPHIHAICVGKFLDNKVLSHVWHGITHTSYIVDCRSIKDPTKVAIYVARYAARPCSLKTLPIERRLEVIAAFHGRRLHNAWGKLARVGLPPREKFDPEIWAPVGSWQEVAAGMQHPGTAKKIWDAWRNHTPLGEATTMIVDVLVCPAEPRPPPRKKAIVLPDLPNLGVVSKTVHTR